MIYDFKTGGCRDGLTPDGPNFNQGAESTLAWLVSLLTFQIQVARQTLLAKDMESRTDKISLPEKHKQEAGASKAKV